MTLTRAVETAELRPGHRISRVIRGGWQLAGDHGAVDREAAIRDMERFVEAGLTTIDCADIYTGVEEMIGTFIADLRRRRGARLADRVVVHTKLVPDLALLGEIGPDGVEAIVDRSLARLGVERLDMVQFFWWDLEKGDPLGALEALKRCQSNGKIATLGTTNWDVGDLARFVSAGFDLASAQVQYSLLDRRAEGGLADWAGPQNMALLAYGTLAGGFLTDAWLGRADPGFGFENRSLVKYRLIIDEFGPWERFQRLLGVLRSVGDRHGVSVATVATRWVLDQPGVAGTIVGARYARHLPQTLAVFDLSLGAEDHAEISSVLAEADGPSGPVFGLERDRRSRHGRIMKYNLNTRPDDAILGDAHG